jgi:hypothetical protein
MAAFAVVLACFNNVAVSVTAQRDAGTLKRTNGTPLPSAVFARILHATLVAVLLVTVTAAFGRLFYGADVPAGMALLLFLPGIFIPMGDNTPRADHVDRASSRSATSPTPRRPAPRGPPSTEWTSSSSQPGDSSGCWPRCGTSAENHAATDMTP